MKNMYLFYLWQSLSYYQYLLKKMVIAKPQVFIDQIFNCGNYGHMAYEYISSISTRSSESKIDANYYAWNKYGHKDKECKSSV